MLAENVGVCHMLMLNEFWFRMWWCLRMNVNVWWKMLAFNDKSWCVVKKNVSD